MSTEVLGKGMQGRAWIMILVELIKWKQKNLSQAFAEPVMAARPCAVSTRKRMGKEFSPLWTAPIRDV